MGWNAESRVAERIRERVAQVVLFELGDPRIAFTTITRVKLARDFSRCEVFYSVLGTDGDRSKTKHALDEARGYVQREVAKVLRTRTVPHLVFQYDPAIEGAMRVDELIRQAGAERVGDPPAPSEGATDPAAPDAHGNETEDQDDGESRRDRS
jgi:ribosome-binding factor A